MKKLKLYPKTFFYTLGLLLFIVFMAHALLYFLTPQVPLELSADTSHAETMLTAVSYTHLYFFAGCLPHYFCGAFKAEEVSI